jgi:hypothetical protein
MSPFEPAGDQARWRILYELLRPIQPDGVLSYEEMAEALSLDPVADKTTIQLAIRRAARELERRDKRAIDPVRNVGYRVVQAPEHLDLAERHQRKAKNSLVRSNSKVQNVDYNELDLTSRQAFELVGRALTWQLQQMKHLDLRQRNLEEALESVTKGVHRTETDVAQHDERLAWLERRVKELGGESSKSA